MIDAVFKDDRVNAVSLFSVSEEALPKGSQVNLDLKEECLEVSVFREIVWDKGKWTRGKTAMGYMEALQGFKKACFRAGFLGTQSHSHTLCSPPLTET